MTKKNLYKESVSNFVGLKVMNSVGILLSVIYFALLRSLFKKRRKMWVRQNLI